MPVTEQEVATALPPSGFIKTYVQHGCLQTTAPLIYHVGVGMTLLAATCPLAYGMDYAGHLHANNFCLLVGRSGEDRKSSALNVGTRLLYQAAAPLIGEYPGSAEGLIESLQAAPSQIIPMSEFGKFLASAQRGYFEPIKTLLADAWDCLTGDTDVLTPAGWVNIKDLRAGDVVWSLNKDTDELVESKVHEARGRPVRQDERLVSLKSKIHDICTTEGHDFYIKYRDPKKKYGPSERYLKKTGAQMVARKSAYYLPFAAKPTKQFEGVKLSDKVLRLIAWGITDSWLGRSKLHLFQSEHKHAARIESLLDSLKLDYTKRVRTAEDNNARDDDGSYTASSNGVTFIIPKGTHGGSLKRRGWADVIPEGETYLDKDLAADLMNMTDRQFRLFWHEMLLADGEQVGEEGSMTGLLWTTRQVVVDKLQQMAVERGYTTQYGTRELPSGKTGYRLSITENRRLICTSPGDKRSVRFTFVEPEPGQMVYCATTEFGTLVTRRNGKVVILGNCHPIQRRKANNKVVKVDNPRLSIAAACSIPYLEKHTLAEDWSGGFMGRWMVLYGRRQRVDPDPVGDKSREPWLIQELTKRATTPSAGYCKGLDPVAKRMWDTWYKDIMHRQMPSNIVGVRARAPTLARKICLIYGWDYGPALAGQPWRIDMSILEPALAFTELHIKSLIHLSEVIAEHPDARLRRSILRAIEEKGGLATLGEILGIMKMRKRPIVEMLDALMEEKKVRRVKTPMGITYDIAY